MATILKGLPQVSQDGLFFWHTDKTGEYAAVTNEGGWGAPNFELNQSAILHFGYRKTTPKTIIPQVAATVKHQAGAVNTDEIAFQMDYDADGWHDFNSVRLMVSANDVSSIDDTPIVFTEGDIWYNSIDGLVKQIVSAAVVELDLTDTDVLDAIFTSEATTLLCEQLFFKDLSVEKNVFYTNGSKARREEDTAQEQRMLTEQMKILLGTAAAAYQFSFGLKVNAQNEIESMLDNYNLN